MKMAGDEEWEQSMKTGNWGGVSFGSTEDFVAEDLGSYDAGVPML